MKKLIFLNLLFILPYQIRSMERAAGSWLPYGQQVANLANAATTIAENLTKERGLNINVPELKILAEKLESAIKIAAVSLYVSPLSIANAINSILKESKPEIQAIIQVLNKAPEEIAKALEIVTQRSLIPALDGLNRQVVNPLVKEGIRVNHNINHNIDINPNLIKTLSLATVGTVAAILSIFILYKEINHDSTESFKVSKPVSWKKRAKNFIKSKGFLGATGLTAGILLALKSSSLAERI